MFFSSANFNRSLGQQVEGGGAKGVSGLSIKKNKSFFAASLKYTKKNRSN